VGNEDSDGELGGFEDSAVEIQDLSSFGLTDQGKVRRNNQDQFLIAGLSKSLRVSATSLALESRIFGSNQGEILMVADGMGGHAAGEKASELAVTHLVKRLVGKIHWHFYGEEHREEEFVENLAGLLTDASAKIRRESSRDVAKLGMGTTLTLAYLIWPRLYVVHAGDSRCYVVRDGEAQQITTDHTLARQMVEAGGLRPEDEAGSRWSNVLWNVLGGQSERATIAEVKRVDLQPGDTIVLCSDGLHRYVDRHTLADTIKRSATVEAAVRDLLNQALDGGGEDNITVVVSQPVVAETRRTVDAGSAIDLEDFELVRDRPPNDLPFGADGLEDTLPG